MINSSPVTSPKFLFTIGFLTVLISLSFGQCPSQSAFEAGGTFSTSGTCDISTFGDINLSNEVILTGGGTFTFSSSTTGLIIENGGRVIIESGTTLNMDINENDQIEVDQGGELIVNGTLIMDDFGLSNNLIIDGGTVTVTGQIDAGNDLEVHDNGTLIVAVGGVVNVDDDLNNTEGNTSNPGTVILLGTLNVGDNIDWEDTATPPSQIKGEGSLSVVNYNVDNFANSDCNPCASSSPCTCSGGLGGSFSIDPISSASINEGSIYTGPTPTISGTPFGALTYSLGGADAADFSIDTGTGVVSMVARDFDNPVDANLDNVYELTITAIDGIGSTDSEGWTVTIQNAVSPGDISSPMALWLKADEDVFEDYNILHVPTGDPAEDGDPANSWADQSGARFNAFDASQMDAFSLGSAPTFRLEGMNYHAAVEFDGIDNGLTLANDFIFSSGSGLAIYVVLQPDDNPSKQYPAVFGHSRQAKSKSRLNCS